VAAVCDKVGACEVQQPAQLGLPQNNPPGGATPPEWFS
jgi:hypothetical protein